MLAFKSKVVEALRGILDEELAGVERMAALARDEATSSETKSEGKYDTRATEASYLARGQAARISELRSLKGWYEIKDRSLAVSEKVVQLGALIQLDSARVELLFLAPVGGAKVRVSEQDVRVISLSSPLGQALLELEEGEGAEFDTPRGVVDVSVLTIV